MLTNQVQYIPPSAPKLPSFAYDWEQVQNKNCEPCKLLSWKWPKMFASLYPCYRPATPSRIALTPLICMRRITAGQHRAW